MRRKSLLFIYPVFVILLSFQLSNAQGPVQLSFINSIQIVPENESVTAFRLAIYGKNTTTRYVDIGIVTQNTSGESKGVQWSFVGLQNDFTGWQAATFFNYSPGSVKGLMTSAVNYTGHFNGLQIGIVNYTETAYGIQLGLLNIIKKGGMLPFFPLFNFSL